MRSARLIVLTLALGALVGTQAEAQWNVARFGERSNIVYSSYGLDPAMVLTAGYGRVVPIFGHRFQFVVDGGMVMARADANDFRARVGVRTALLSWRSLALTGNMAFVTRGTENSIYRGLNFGSEFALTAGVYRRGWFVASEFGRDKDIITHLTHSDWYRRYYYPQAKDGWYLNAGGTYSYGLTAGVALGRTEVVVRAGRLVTEKFDQMLPPMYASLGIGVGF